MAASVEPSRAATVPSLPPPRPKSPPAYPDLYGKRRETAKVQMLEREIGFLQEELKSAQQIQSASRCCKELADFVASNPDPFIPTNRKKRRSCCFSKWLCRIHCLNLSWLFCCCYSKCCSVHLQTPQCCDCNFSPCQCCSCPNCPNCSSCFSCSLPKWRRFCCSCPRSNCCGNGSFFSKICCTFPTCSCPSSPSCKCRCSCFCPPCL